MSASSLRSKLLSDTSIRGSLAQRAGLIGNTDDLVSTVKRRAAPTLSRAEARAWFLENSASTHDHPELGAYLDKLSAFLTNNGLEYDVRDLRIFDARAREAFVYALVAANRFGFFTHNTWGKACLDGQIPTYSDSYTHGLVYANADHRLVTDNGPDLLMASIAMEVYNVRKNLPGKPALPKVLHEGLGAYVGQSYLRQCAKTSHGLVGTLHRLGHSTATTESHVRVAALADVSCGLPLRYCALEDMANIPLPEGTHRAARIQVIRPWLPAYVLELLFLAAPSLELSMAALCDTGYDTQKLRTEYTRAAIPAEIISLLSCLESNDVSSETTTRDLCACIDALQGFLCQYRGYSFDASGRLNRSSGLTRH